jgi:hypothetical protein
VIMVRTLLRRVAQGFIFGVVVAGSATAQTPGTASRINRNDLRHQTYVMEGALARAVQVGARQVNREMRSFSPELFSLAGEAQARGVYLADYGVFFDVGVPILRQSMMWSFRTIVEQDARSTRDTINVLKRMLGSVRDVAERRTLENTIARLEASLMPDTSPGVLAFPPSQGGLGAPVAQPGSVGAAMVPPDPPSGATPPPPSGGTPTPPRPPSIVPPPVEESRIAPDWAVLKDPNRAYTEAVQRALIDVMIDYGAVIQLGPNEWLTVAARDNEPRDSFALQDPYEEVVTILLRIKGEDLAAYRSGKIDREEAKKRVQLREF